MLQLAMDFDAVVTPQPMGLLDSTRWQAIRLSPWPGRAFWPHAQLGTAPWQMDWQRICPVDSRHLRFVHDDYRDNLESDEE